MSRTAAVDAPIDPALGELLDRVVADEPPAHVTVDEVYGHADRLRRRRLRTALAAASGTVVLVALAGYGITSVWSAGYGPAVLGKVPAVGRPSAAHPSGTARVTPGGAPAADPSGVTSPVSSEVTSGASAAADPVLAVAASAVGTEGHRVVPAGSWHGVGWRRYAVRDAEGRARGTVEVTVYTAPGEFCFPPETAGRRSCAEATSAGGVDHVRYAGVETVAGPDADTDEGGTGGDGGNPGGWRTRGDGDGNGQVNQVIARRSSDGWTVAVVAAGSARDGGAPLGIDEVARMATDPRLPEAFGPDEWCGRPDPNCPAPPVPLPAD